MKIYKYFLLHNKKLKTWIKYWLYHKKAGGSGILSEILHGFSFNLANTLNRKFNLFEIQGNSVQDGTPSPDNEVPIYSAGDNGSINEKIQTRNIFDKNKDVNSTFTTSIKTALQNYKETGKYAKGYTDNGTSLSANEQYNTSFTEIKSGETFTIDNTRSATANLSMVCFLDDNGNVISKNIAWSNQPYTHTATNEEKYIMCSYSITNKDYIQIEPGSTATPYVPHEEQDYSIPVQQPMRSIGDVRDKFVKVNGNWYERHYIGELILNGSESNWYKSSNTTVDRFIYATNQFLQNNLSLCNYFKYSNDSSVKNYWYNNQDIQLCFNFSEPGTTTLEQWKEWLSTHNLTLIQPLETPLDLPCTQSQIEVLENMPSTYKDFTIINSVDETPAYLNIQYYKEV